MPALYILPLNSSSATLDVAGGKGANLSLLLRGGFPVPAGFVVTTRGYDAFVRASQLLPFLNETLSGLTADDPTSLEAASAAIRQRFRSGQLPADLCEAVRAAYLELFPGSSRVAVRSSATSEDLPDLSFAGQQDTYLNVEGTEALLTAVVACWGSLWTARAIGYRARNGIPHDAVSLAVVVQQMVQAEAAGVLFTANPINGRRTESTIDATLGLGEALVSGQIEPDHYVVDAQAGQIIEKRLGAKTAASEGQREDRRSVQALPDAAILDLVALGHAVESSFGTPQDIEWTWAEGKLALVQSRPITSLYPLPPDLPRDAQLRAYASVAAFQGMLDPFTPMGVDALRCFAATVGKVLGYEATWETQGAVKVAGERLYINITPFLRNGFGRRLLRGALSQVEPGIGEAVRQVWDDPRLSVTASRPRLRLLRRAAPVLLPLAARFAIALLRPEAAQRKAEQGVEMAIAYYRGLAARAQTLRQRLVLLEEITNALRKFLLAELFPRFVPGMAAQYQLYRLADELASGRPLAFAVLRGLPHNVTTEMDLALWQTARRIRGDAASAAAFAERDSGALARAYLENRLPPFAQDAVRAFLAHYGMRGLGEIDMGRPRWREDPAPVMEAVQSYMRITDPDQAPDAVFTRGAAAAQRAAEQLAAELRKTSGGWRKAARARWAVRRVRALAGLRESPKFTIINLFGLAREALLDSGAELMRAGLILKKEDIFFLPLAELHALAGAQERGEDLSLWQTKLRASVEQHQARYAHELRRRQIPRLLLSDGTAFYEGVSGLQGQGGASPEGLVGSPVSPGVAEGRVNVVFNPGKAQMQPGDVLVCPGTDPSWTPLFLSASALVMEVGGVMTHGSVVAREYGIPAVVGVDHATNRLRTGQRVRVDGSKGVVIILDDVK
ncbi:MAG: PEP/pyruvate-binding domain-containing protein [Nitrososphaerales archaeon]